MSQTSIETIYSEYEQDYYLWLQATVKLLRDRHFDALDLERLIEEIEGLSKSERRELRNRLTVLIEHLLKLTYWKQEKERCARGWLNTIAIR